MGQANDTTLHEHSGFSLAVGLRLVRLEGLQGEQLVDSAGVGCRYNRSNPWLRTWRLAIYLSVIYIGIAGLGG